MEFPFTLQLLLLPAAIHFWLFPQHIALWKELSNVHSVIHPGYHQFSYTTHRAENHGQTHLWGQLSYNGSCHRNRAVVADGRTSVRAASHAVPSAPFQKDDIPQFSNLAEDLRDTVQPVPKNIPAPILSCHTSPTHKENTCMSLSFKKKSREDESQRGWSACTKSISPHISRLSCLPVTVRKSDRQWCCQSGHCPLGI